MVPRLHQSNGYIKRKLRVWKAQKCVALGGPKFRIFQFPTLYCPPWNGVVCGPALASTVSAPIPMVPRLHQSNGYIKRKLRVWKAHKCIALVGAETVLTSAVRKLHRFMGGSIRSGIEISETSGQPIHMVPCLHQSNLYIKRNLGVCRA